MAYKVVNTFRDLEDKNKLYRVGEVYPKGDHKPTKKRIEELSSIHPEQKRIFIEETEDENEKADREAKESEEKDAIRTELESLGVSVHPNTGLEKLKEKLVEAKAGKASKE